jgi:hypothetical protein
MFQETVFGDEFGRERAADETAAGSPVIDRFQETTVRRLMTAAASHLADADAQQRLLA